MGEAARQKALESFLTSPAAQGYGYNGRIDTIRQEQYPQIKDTVYLDHAGATLPAQDTLQRFTADLTQNLYANPHSKSPSSQATSARVHAVRQKILEHFHASTRGEWDVIFTSNATAAIKLVGEAFPWTNTWEQATTTTTTASTTTTTTGKAPSRLLLLREAHTSLVGLRALADDPSKAIEVETLERATIEACLEQQPQSQQPSDASSNSATSYNLFAYPAQCNFSGRRFPVSWAQPIRERLSTAKAKTLVLLDAASYVMTSSISLHDVEASPDFMVVSFYKMFGMPTGLGCLIVKTEHRDLLHKRYFGGGTVSAITSDVSWQVYRDSLHGRFEDGTLNFIDIIALDHALASTKALYGDGGGGGGCYGNITSHVSSLHRLLYNGLCQLKHWNGSPVCTLYVEHAPQDPEGHPSSLVGDPTEYGPIINFNLKQSNGKWIGYGQVERLASMKGIHVRTGGFCNPGSMQRWLELSSDQVKKNLEAGHVCWDDTDILDDKPTGSIRVSLGAMSTAQDVLYMLDFLSEYFVETSDPNAMVDLLGVSDDKQTQDQGHVEVDSLIIYPIKSCRGYKIPAGKAWPIEPHGLRYDREWMLVDATTGAALTQKRFPRMCLIHAEVLLEKKQMVIECDDPASSLNTPPPSPRPSSPVMSSASGGSAESHGVHQNQVNAALACSEKEDDRRRLIISLDELDASQHRLLGEESRPFQTSSSRVCGDCTKVISYEDPQIHEWFSTFLGHPCRLVRQPPPAKKDDGSRLVSTRHVKAHLNAPQGAPITLTNESPFLLIADKSVERVQEWIDQHDDGQGKVRRQALAATAGPKDEVEAQHRRHQFTSDSFRANFVTRGQQVGFEEDGWSRIQVGRQVFDILGGCRRCHMVTIDQKRATKNNDVFLALSKHRKGAGGQIFFGMHMLHRPDLSVAPYQVQIGDPIRTLSHSM